MKSLLFVVLLGVFCQSAFAEELYDGEVAANEARFLYFNSSSTATSLTLLGALILLGVIAYLVYAGGLLGSSSGYNRYGYDYPPHPQEYPYDQGQYSQYR